MFIQKMFGVWWWNDVSCSDKAINLRIETTSRRNEEDKFQKNKMITEELKPNPIIFQDISDRQLLLS